MPRLRPHQPIFDIDKTIGSVAVGNTPAGSPEICMTVLGSVTGTNLDDVRGIWVEGAYAYCAVNQSGSTGRLTIVNISDSTAPFLVSGGSLNATDLDGASKLVKSGNYVYVTAASESGLCIVDVSTVTSPTEVGFIADPDLSGAWGIAKSGNYVFVAASTGDVLCIVEVSNPAAPFVEGSVADININGPVGVAISGTTAFLTSQATDRLFAIDITDPSAPSIISSLTSGAFDSPEGITIVGDVAWVVSLGGVLAAVDISNPASMSVLGSYSNAGILGASYVVATPTRAYVTSSSTDSVKGFDVTDPTSPTPLPSPYATTSDPTTLAAADGIFLVGDKLYVVSNDADSLAVIGC